MSKRSRQAILLALSKYYTDVRITIVDDRADLEALVERKPDLVFLGMKFVPANPLLGLKDRNRVWISQYLDEYGITYTGSNQIANELEANKPLAKQCSINAGLKTSPYYVIKQNQKFSEADIALTYPLFVKPTDRGGGMGIDSNSIVNNFAELQSKVKSITNKVKSDSLIEEYLPGREISVAILKNELTNEFLIMPIERIVPPDEHGARILSVEMKLADAGLSVAVAAGKVKDQVSELAINVFHALGARDYARIDIRLDNAGVPNFLEANLIPSLIEGYGNFPKSCLLNTGLEYEPMLLNIINLAFARSLNIIESEQTSNVLPVLEPEIA